MNAEPRAYRPNVGIMLVNAKNKVFVGQRLDRFTNERKTASHIKIMTATIVSIRFLRRIPSVIDLLKSPKMKFSVGVFLIQVLLIYV